MSAERKPEVVDLSQYKKARAEAQAPKPAAKPAKGAGEPLLGGRPKAGLILAALIVALVAAAVLPKLL